MVFRQYPLDVTHAPVVLGRSTLLWQSWKWLWYEINSWIINIDLKKLSSLLINHWIFAVSICPSANKVTTRYLVKLTIPNQSKHRGFHEVVNSRMVCSLWKFCTLICVRNYMTPPHNWLSNFRHKLRHKARYDCCIRKMSCQDNWFREIVECSKHPEFNSRYITRYVLSECQVNDDAIRILAVVIMCKYFFV